MQFKVEFTDKREDDNCFEILLTKIGFSRCNNYDGRIYVHKDPEIAFETVINYLCSKKWKILNIGWIRFHKKIDAALCLLVNPYFDQTIEYIKSYHDELPVYFLKRLKKQVFLSLANEAKVNTYEEIPYIEGAQFYMQHNCFKVSKEMIEIIDKSI